MHYLIRVCLILTLLGSLGCAGLEKEFSKPSQDSKPKKKATVSSVQKAAKEKASKPKPASGPESKKADREKKPPLPPPPPEPREFSRERPYLRISLPADFQVEAGGPEEPGLLLRAWGGPQGPRIVIRARPLDKALSPSEFVKKLGRAEQDRLYRQLGRADFGAVRRIKLGGLKGIELNYRAGGKSYLRYVLPGKDWFYVITLAPVHGKKPQASEALLDSLELTAGSAPILTAKANQPVSPTQEVRALAYSFNPKDMAEARQRLRGMRKLRPKDKNLLFLQTEAVALQALVLKRLGLKAKSVNWAGQRGRTVVAWRTMKNSGQANRALGLAKFMEGNKDKALKYLGEAIRLSPEQGANYLALAIIQEGPSQREVQASKALDAGLSQPAAYLTKAWALEDQGSAALAAPQYEAVLESHPENLPALEGLARLKMDDPAGKDHAAALWGRVLRLQPDNSGALFNLALVRLMQEKPEEAKRLAAEVLAVSPGDAPALNLMGLAYKAQKKYKKAAESYKAAIEADPKYAQAYYNQGALYATGLIDVTKAYLSFKRFLELEPQGPRADKVRQWIRNNSG